jgi:predicted transcriptional regulator
VTVRVTVDLPRAAVDALQEVADKRKTTRTEVLLHAISLEQQVYQELSQEEAKLLIQKKDGSLEEVVVFP